VWSTTVSVQQPGEEVIDEFHRLGLIGDSRVLVGWKH